MMEFDQIKQTYEKLQHGLLSNGQEEDLIDTFLESPDYDEPPNNIYQSEFKDCNRMLNTRLYLLNVQYAVANVIDYYSKQEIRLNEQYVEELKEISGLLAYEQQDQYNWYLKTARNQGNGIIQIQDLFVDDETLRDDNLIYMYDIRNDVIPNLDIYKVLASKTGILTKNKKYHVKLLGDQFEEFPDMIIHRQITDNIYVPCFFGYLNNKNFGKENRDIIEQETQCPFQTAFDNNILFLYLQRDKLVQIEDLKLNKQQIINELLGIDEPFFRAYVQYEILRRMQ